MTTIDTITKNAGALAEGYEPEAIARAFWTLICEPNDLIAGELINTVGPVEAVEVAMGTSQVTDSDDLATLKERVKARANGNQFAQVLRATARFGVQLVTPDSDYWPKGMNDLGNAAPFALWVRGNVELLAGSDQIAIVGARAATGYGEHVTMELAAGLSDRGRTIVSGAAYGIDGMAHRAALASHGKTIAYLAGGVDRYYPSGHEALLTRIAEEGAVVSEMPVTSPPTKWRFIARNRLIAAATHATIVIEAGWWSGSLNTAGHAHFLGRAVGAVPGPVTSAASAGCHRLIRDYGATLVTNADEAAEL
jgi:DNA processing protein